MFGVRVCKAKCVLKFYFFTLDRLHRNARASNSGECGRCRDGWRSRKEGRRVEGEGVGEATVYPEARKMNGDEETRQQCSQSDTAYY